MAVIHNKNTGSTGKITVYDRTHYTNAQALDVYISSTQYVPVTVRWSYLLNGVVKGSGVEGEMFENSLTQFMGSFWVPPEYQTFTFRIENTGTSQLGGPTELTFTPAGYQSDLVVGTVRIKVGETYKQATPYVRSNGVWKLAKPFVKQPKGWKETT